jgi:hypothetical protein
MAEEERETAAHHSIAAGADVAASRPMILPPPAHVAPTLPFRPEWTMDAESCATGWTMAYVATTENRRPATDDVLGPFAGGRGTAGESGILDRIFQLVGETNRWCCEFGASDGMFECNTYDLVRERGWSAVYIEPGPEKFDRLEAAYRDRPDVFAFRRFVNFEAPGTIDEILAETRCPRDLDLMVIDIDGSDYHVWESVETYQARVVMIEFNSAIPTEVSYIPPRDLNIRHGASLLAITELGLRRGYELVGTSKWNAFFVKRELFDRFGIADNHPAALHRSETVMRLFQLYDGTLVLGAWAQLHWVKLRLSLEDIQVLPKGLRRFSRALARSSTTMRPDGVDSGASAASCHFTPTTANRYGALARDITSDHGDDGIIEALLGLLTCENRCFVDIACFGNREGSRVWHPTTRGGWTGYVVRVPAPGGAWERGDDFPMDRITYIDLAEINFTRAAWVESIRCALRSKIDFLSIGVDGADYQIWQALAGLQPVLVAVQFNPTIANDIFFVQAPSFEVHHGCSLNALIEFGRQEGYELAACSLATAFFVRADRSHDIGALNNDIDAMYAPLSMHLFQLYDGSFRLAGLRQLLWHRIALAEDEIQVLPRALRRWPADVPTGPHAALFVEVN